jgi:hypothetical protein
MLRGTMDLPLGVVKHRVGTALGRPRRWRYLEHLPKGGVGAEIGVFRGEFTPHILRVTRPRHLHLIDGWWELYGDRYPDWGEYTEHGQLETRRAYAEARRRTDGQKVTFHVGDDLSVLPEFPNLYFDWVYLDSSHQYDHTLKELAILTRKVKLVIMGDDWTDQEDADGPNAGCARAVRDFCAAPGWTLLEPDHVFAQWSMIRQQNLAAGV